MMPVTFERKDRLLKITYEGTVSRDDQLNALNWVNSIIASNPWSKHTNGRIK
jgi:hypothetical protein